MRNTLVQYTKGMGPSRRDFLRVTGAIAGSSLLVSGAAARPDRAVPSGLHGTPATGNDAGWPQQRYSAANTGYHPTAHGPRTGLEERWRFEVDAPTTEPVVSDGVVYVAGREDDPDDGSHRGVLYAVDATDGSVRWSVGRDEGTDALAVDERRLYASGGSIRAYSLDDGTTEWTVPIATSRPSDDGGLALSGNRLYVTDRETVYSIDAASGTVVWRRTLGGRLTSPAVSGRCVYVGRVSGDGGLDRTLVALGARTGRVQWRHDLDRPFASEANIVGPPVVADGRVYLRVTAGGEEDILRAPAFGFVSVDRATGGDERTISSVYAGFGLHPIAAGGGRVYATAVDYDSVSALVARDLDGTGGWSIYGDGEFGVSTAPTVAGGVLYVGADSSEFGVETDRLYAIDAPTGSIVATADLPVTAPPVVAEGTVYVLSEDILYAIEEPTAED